jgi:hypothetical protein
MFGADTGALRALVLTNITSTTMSTEAKLWELSGQNGNGNDWQGATVNISALYTGQPFQVTSQSQNTR